MQRIDLLSVPFFKGCFKAQINHAQHLRFNKLTEYVLAERLQLDMFRSNLKFEQTVFPLRGPRVDHSANSSDLFGKVLGKVVFWANPVPPVAWMNCSRCCFWVVSSIAKSFSVGLALTRTTNVQDWHRSSKLLRSSCKSSQCKRPCSPRPNREVFPIGHCHRSRVVAIDLELVFQWMSRRIRGIAEGIPPPIISTIDVTTQV